MKIKSFSAVLLILILIMCGCDASGIQADQEQAAPTASPAETASQATDAPAATPVSGISGGDYTALGWNDSAVTEILLSDGAIVINGSGAAVSGDVITISAAGDYLLTGRLSDGQIIVDADKDDSVRIILNGVNITSKTGAGIYAKKADEVIITLAEGSENYIEDGSDYGLGADEDEPNAAIFAKDDLVINGSGALYVTGNYNNGIGTKDDLTITQSVITVSAVNHAIRGRDSVTVLDAELNLTSGADGIQSNNDEDEEKGWIYIENSNIGIISGNDGIQAETTLTILSGSFVINSGLNTAAVSSESYKGLKAGGDMVISGGSFSIDSADDTIHSNGNVTISGGDFALTSGDDGVHADECLTISGGNIIIAKSYEGLEGAQVIISGGYIDLVASDDGINAAGGAGGAGDMMGFFGGDRFSSASGDYYIEITGGEIYVNAGGDGVDSNGDIRMSGGAVYVSGPTASGNGALDCDGTFTLSGGILMAAGSSGMAETPSASSSQPSIMIYFSEAQKSGPAVALKDSSGNTLVEFAPKKDFQCAVISAPELAPNGTYSIVVGGKQTGSVTVASAVTSVNESGSAVNGGGGMGMRPGNNQNQPGGNRR